MVRLLGVMLFATGFLACGTETEDDGGDAGPAAGGEGGGAGAGGETGGGQPAGGGGAGEGCSDPSCIHAAGTLNGVAFDFTCATSADGFEPTILGENQLSYSGVCGDGINTDGFATTYNVNLNISEEGEADVEARAYQITPTAVVIDNVRLVLAITRSPSTQMSETSPNFVEATITVTSYEPKVSISGTFTGRWGDEFTIDAHAPYVHTQVCTAWEGTGCDVGQGEAVPPDCVCTEHVPFNTGEVTGEFNWKF